MEEKSERGKREMELAMEAGRILLENGAEISRVSETIRCICRAYGIQSEHDFVLSNGIFMTGSQAGEQSFAKVLHVPISGICLGKVAAVNQLSREIEKGSYTVEEAEKELWRIEQMPEEKNSWKLLATAVGSAAFCYFFGGNQKDSMIAFLAGLLLYGVLYGLSELGLSKITKHIAGGLLVTLICGTARVLNLGTHMDYMIIGSIMPMIPGVAFINSIREIASGDYIAGAVRMLDTMVVFFSTAMGVGIGIFLLNQIIGGVLL